MTWLILLFHSKHVAVRKERRPLGDSPQLLDFRMTLMHVYVRLANFTMHPEFRFKMANCYGWHKCMPKAVELKGIPTHKECNCEQDISMLTNEA